jgi:Zn-dependent protease/CBS domain-containing protein
MHGGIRFGRILGIDVRIDWSWLIISFLVAWNVAMVFASLHPEWSAALRWVNAGIAAFLVLVSVLSHELAHSLVARAQGIRVSGITLFLFGGVSNFEREPDSPLGEIVMALVGPITSLFLGGLFMLVVIGSPDALRTITIDAAQGLAQLHAMSMVAVWLGSINVLLGLFNLIPGFPLDGGRVLRAALWAVTGDLRSATRWASGAGQAIGWLMIVAGIAMILGMYIPLLGTGLMGGVWLSLIGWFLRGAAVQAYQQIIIGDALSAMSVASMMRSSPPTVPADLSVASLVRDHAIGADHRAWVVLEDGRPAGLVTLEDLRGVSRDSWDTTMVGKIMTPVSQLTVASPEEEAAAALKKLIGTGAAQLPVLSDGKLAGLLYQQDIVNWLALYSGLEAG